MQPALLASCVPLIPVPVQSICCLGNICGSIPTKGDLGMPSLAYICCVLEEGRSNGEQGVGSTRVWDEGHKQEVCVGCPELEPGALEEWAGIGAWQKGRQIGQRTHSSLCFLPHTTFISPLRASVHLQYSLAGCGAGVPAGLVVGCRGCAHPAGLCLHWSCALP